MKRIIGLLIVIGLVYGGYYGYMMWQASYTPVSRQMPAQSVDVITASEHSFTPEAEFVAKIQSRDNVGLRARVTGFLQEKLFNEGDFVKQGQPLFLIEKVNFEAQVRQAEANLAKAEAAAVNAKAQYDRSEKLFKTKDISAAKLDEMKATYASANATVAQMKAALDLARKDLEYTTIVSPMDGKIGEKNFSVGELIGPSSGVLAEVVSTNPIDAVFSVSENQLLQLQEQFGREEDATVQFITSNGKTYPQQGTIKFVDIALDEAMNTLKMKASFPNPENHLIAGQYGRVRLTANRQQERIIIPMKAVQRDLSSAYVYLVNADSKIEKREVKTGLELPNFQVVIEDGLTGGEQIVVAGFQKIAPNMTVSPNPMQGE